jgi:hypothetical protein
LAILGGFAMPAEGVQHFGFSTSANRNDLEHEIPPDVVASLGKQAGADVLRLDLSWKAVEKTGPQDAFWGQYDAAIGAMRAEGIKPLIMIANAPKWAAHPNCTNDAHCPPAGDRLDEFAVFVKEVANRYPDAAALEIWNAPNTYAWWSLRNTGPNAAHYAKVFNWAATAIHRVQPSIPVLFGSLGIANGNKDPQSETAIPTYLPKFYANVDRARALRPGDGLSIHPYPSRSELDGFDGRFATTMSQARQVRDKYDPSRKLWITETGMTTTGEFSVTPQQQAVVNDRAVKYLKAQTDVAAAIIYTLIESKYSTSVAFEKGYGVVAREGSTLTPKPSFCAFAFYAGTPKAETGCP